MKKNFGNHIKKEKMEYTVVTLGGIKFTTKSSMEIFAENEFGFDVKITFNENIFKRNEPDLFHNVTEVHLYYDTINNRESHAFESGIHCTGCTRWQEHNIKEIEITNSEKKYDRF